MPRFSFRCAVIAVAVVGVVQAADPKPAVPQFAVPSSPPVSTLPPAAATPKPVSVNPPPVASAPPAEAVGVDAPAGDSADGGACGTLCGGGGCGGGVCGDAWIGVEWLYWGATGHYLPPLLRSTAVGAGTRTVVGDRVYNDEWRNGFRLNAGLWIGALHRVGFEADFFFLGRSRERDAVSADGTAGSPLLTRPFLQTVRRNADNTFTPVEPFTSSQLVALPGVFAGALTTDMTSEFSGAGVNVVWNMGGDPCAAYRCTLGYRYLNLTDTLVIGNQVVTLDQAGNPAALFATDERFRVENHFHGVPIGFSCERSGGKCFVNVRASVAVGVTRSVVDIDGSTTTIAGGVGRQSTGALLALPSNIGAFTHDTFAVVPEAGVRFGWQCGCAKMYLGYNFLYWSSVVRAGGVLDQRVNVSQQPNNGPVTGPLFPRVQARTIDFFAHGAMIGLEFSF